MSNAGHLLTISGSSHILARGKHKLWELGGPRAMGTPQHRRSPPVLREGKQGAPPAASCPPQQTWGLTHINGHWQHSAFWKHNAFFFFFPLQNFIIIFFPPTPSYRWREETLLPTSPSPPTPPFRLLPPALPACWSWLWQSHRSGPLPGSWTRGGGGAGAARCGRRAGGRAGPCSSGRRSPCRGSAPSRSPTRGSGCGGRGPPPPAAARGPAATSTSGSAGFSHPFPKRRQSKNKIIKIYIFFFKKKKRAYKRKKNKQHGEYKTNTFGSAETEQEFYHKCLIFPTIQVKQSNEHSGHFILDNSKD